MSGLYETLVAAPAHGAFWALVFLVAFVTLLAFRAGAVLWWPVGIGLLTAFSLYADATTIATRVVAWVLFLVPASLLGVTPIRRRFVSNPVLARYRAGVTAQDTGQLQAGRAATVWWGRDFFSGKLRFRRMFRGTPPVQDERERRFVDEAVARLCAEVDDYVTNHEAHDLSEKAWRSLRSEGFCGLAIATEHGGLGFSPCGQSAVLTTVATRSTNAALAIASIAIAGTTHLLQRFGTPAQKDRWLPRIADGSVTPCFAVTGPEAGSDVGAMPDVGIVCRTDTVEGGLGIRLRFDKRYVTLAPVADLAAVAFRLCDPDRLLSDNEEPGLTVALVRTDAASVSAGLRHRSLNLGLPTGPLRGEVTLSVDAIVGGAGNAGQGWRMIVESVNVGRTIVQPAIAAGTAKIAARSAGAYARVRFQFATPIGFTEGVQGVLARIGGCTHAVEAIRRALVAALTHGHRPAAIATAAKVAVTERARSIVRDAIDIHGGKGLCLGPANLVGELRENVDVAVVVDGPNVLARNRLIYAQGVIRCHPFLGREIEAAADPDLTAGETRFDRLFAGHLRLALGNAVRAKMLALFGGRLATVPLGAGRNNRPHYRQLSRMTAAFAVVTEMLLLTLEGAFEKHERHSARMADALASLFVIAAVLQVARQAGDDDGAQALTDWVVATELKTVQESLIGVCDNLRPRWLGRLLALGIFPFGRPYRAPPDALDKRVAQLLLVPSTSRDRLTAGVWLPPGTDEPLARLEEALAKVVDTKPLHRKLRAALDVNLISGATLAERLDSAVAAQVLTRDEAERLRAAERVRASVLAVDEFGSQRRGGDAARSN